MPVTRAEPRGRDAAGRRMAAGALAGMADAVLRAAVARSPHGALARTLTGVLVAVLAAPSPSALRTRYEASGLGSASRISAVSACLMKK